MALGLLRWAPEQGPKAVLFWPPFFKGIGLQFVLPIASQNKPLSHQEISPKMNKCLADFAPMLRPKAGPQNCQQNKKVGADLAKMASMRPEMPPQMSQTGPRSAHNSPRQSQDKPKTTQDRPKTSPR